MKSLETLKAERDKILQQLDDDELDLSTKKIIDLSNELASIEIVINNLTAVKGSVKKNSNSFLKIFSSRRAS